MIIINCDRELNTIIEFVRKITVGFRPQSVWGMSYVDGREAYSKELSENVVDVFFNR